MLRSIAYFLSTVNLFEGNSLEEVCRKVNDGAVILPDGRRLVVAVGKRLHVGLDGPLAQTG